MAALTKVTEVLANKLHSNLCHRYYSQMGHDDFFNEAYTLLNVLAMISMQQNIKVAE